jgi:predicted O-methyltransferase YrrM
VSEEHQRIKNLICDTPTVTRNAVFRAHIPRYAHLPDISAPAPNPVVAPDHVLALLDRLHQESLTQEAALPSTYLSSGGFDELMRDKFIALDQDKCQFVYQLARATGARNIAEIGTSFGVSTIYLALAVGSNLDRLGGEGKVIATEKEHTKAEKARQYWQEAGNDLVTRHIDLREGDLLETLTKNIPQIDLILLDSELTLGNVVNLRN